MAKAKEKKIKELVTISLSSKWLPAYKISTGVIAFDMVLGGGLPSGRIIEMYGGESSYKSLVVLQSLANAVEDEDNLVVYSDNERSIEKGLVEMVTSDVQMFVDRLEYLDVSKMVSAKDIFEQIEYGLNKAKKLGKRLIFGWDSIGATPGHEDLVKEIGRNEAGARRAKLIKDGLDKYGSRIASEDAILILVNWTMDRFGVMFGEAETTPGGRAIKFWSSVRMKFKNTGKIVDDKSKEQIGGKGNLLIRKNKAGRPFGQVNFEHYAMEPLSKYAGLLDYLWRHGSILQAGAYYYFIGDKDNKFYSEDFPERYEDWAKGRK